MHITFMLDLLFCTFKFCTLKLCTRRAALWATVCTSLLISSHSVQATTIDFDDLIFTPSESGFDCFCDHPLTDQYLSKGLLINEGYLAQYWSGDQPTVVSRPNYLLGGNTLRLSFVEAFPTYLSMFVSSSREDVIYMDVYGAAGWVASKKTTG